MKKYLLILSFVLSITCIAQPTINSFSPSSGPVGTSAVISGAGFSTTASANTVYFGSVKATVTAATATSLTVTVPTGSTYQPICVLVNKLLAYSTKAFKVTFAGNGVAFNTATLVRTKNVSSGASPRSVRTVDFDGDGKTDLVTSNQSGGTLAIFRNTSTSATDSFAAKIELIAGTGVFKICTGDLNGDGKPDMVVSNNNSGNAGAISIFRNTSTSGNISFGPKIDSSIGNGPLGLAIADLDGDGKPEVLVAAGNSGYISVFKNTSVNDSISFAAKINVSNSGHADNILVRDIDGDGKPDLVASNFSSSSISVYRNTSTTGNISFAPKVDFTVGTNPGDIVCGDLDGDGIIDIAVSNYSSTSISILRNTSTSGNISFAAKTDITTGSNPMELALEDLDGDGKTDIGVVNNLSNTVSIFKNTGSSGTISFASKIDFTTELAPTGICMVDLNGDGKPDIATTNSSSGTFSLFRNKLSEPKISSFLPTTATIGDTVTIKGFNLTGTSIVSFGAVSATSFTVVSDTVVTAIIGAATSGYIAVRTTYGIDSLSGFQFLSPPTISSFAPTSAAVGATLTITGKYFNSTAVNNIVYFGAVKAKVLASTDSSLTVTVPPGATYQVISVTANKLTGYSTKPFITTFSHGSDGFRPRSFIKQFEASTGGYSTSTAITDLNGDGKPDIVAAIYDGKAILVFQNNGAKDSIAFKSAVSYQAGTAPIVIKVADLDGDGKPDILIGDEKDNSLTIYRNTTTGDSITFAAKQDLAISNGTLSIHIIDLNGDGKPDIAGISSIGITYFIKNISVQGNIKFSSINSFLPVNSGGFVSFIASIDIDGDGKTDLAAINRVNKTVVIWRNTSTIESISFKEATEVLVPGRPGTIALGDISGDGKPDIVVSSTDSNLIVVFRNKSVPGTVLLDSKLYTFATSFFPETVIMGDLDGDGKTDISVSNINASAFSVFKNIRSADDTVLLAPRMDYFQTNPNQTSIRNIAAGDLDGDGFPDMITTSYSTNKLAVFRNTLRQPLINSVTPNSVAAGSIITIKGKNFTGVSEVNISAKKSASITVSSDSLVTAILPATNSGYLVVKNIYGVDSAAFTYASPRIDSIVPLYGPPGTSVTIYGANFDSLATNIVYFGAVQATVKQAGSKSIIVTAPASATYSPVTLTEKGYTVYANYPFITTTTDTATNTIPFFQKVATLASGGSQAFEVKAKDLNGDGKADIVVNNRVTGGFSIFRNNSTKDSVSFTRMPELPTGKYTIFTFGDMDGDGKPDLVTVNDDSIRSLIIFRNSSTADSISFGPKITFSKLGDNPVNLLDIAVQDLDGDGRPDVLVEFLGATNVSLFRNTTENSSANISLTDRINYETGSSPFITLAMAVGDLDNDKKPELVFGNNDNTLSVLKNISVPGSIKFAPRKVVNTRFYPSNVAIGDIDNDGNPDLICSYQKDSIIVVLKSKSTPDSLSFANPLEIVTTNIPYGLSLSDINGDGKTDILAMFGDLNGGRLAIFRNNSSTGKPSFINPTDDIHGIGTFQNIIAADINGDAKQDIALTNSGTSLIILKNITGATAISSFSPKDAGTGATVTLKGKGFGDVTQVNFGGTAASSFKVVSDSVITAVVGNGSSGFLSISTIAIKDSLPGFVYGSPIIRLIPADTTLSFGAQKTVYSRVQNYSVTGKYLQNALLITAPGNFQVSRSADSAFASSISITPQNGNLDTIKIYARFKSDTLGINTGSILHTSLAAASKSLTVTGNSQCDVVVTLTPVINNIQSDTVLCFKDSLTLSTTSGTFSTYKWSTGETTQNIIVKTSGTVSLQVGSSTGCLSNPSLNLKTSKNINPVPLLALSGDSTLISSSAPNYRWYFNNTPLPGNTSNKLIVRKTGFYSVETSNDKVCWDHSNDFPILTLATPLLNDSVSVKSYPNPTSTGLFYIVATLQRATNVVAKVTVSDISGNILLQTNKFIFFGREIKIPVTLSVKGTVFAKIDINGDVKTQTVILQ